MEVVHTVAVDTVVVVGSTAAVGTPAGCTVVGVGTVRTSGGRFVEEGEGHTQAVLDMQGDAEVHSLAEEVEQGAGQLKNREHCIN